MMGSMVGWIVLVLRVNEDSNKNQTEWSPNMQLPPYPYIHAPPSLFGCEAGSLRLGPPGKWLKKMNKLYSIQIYYEIHESWAPTSSVHRLELPTYTWRVKNIQTWPTKGVSKGKGSISGLYIYIYTWPIKFHLTKQQKQKQHVWSGQISWNPYMKAIWRSIPIPIYLNLQWGIFRSTNSHTSRGVKNYPVILTIQYRILYNILHHSNHDLPINKTRTQFRKFSHFLTTPTCKSAPIFDHISPKSWKQATHHLFLGNQNAHVKNLHLPSDEKP